MQRRRLGSTGLDVTEVGYGGWNIGGDWGDVTDAEGRRAVRAALDAGVTFLDAVDALRPHVPEGATMAQFALRWILDHDAVSTVIPGSTSPEHVRENVAAADLPPLSNETRGAVRDVHEEFVYDHVHHQW